MFDNVRIKVTVRLEFASLGSAKGPKPLMSVNRHSHFDKSHSDFENGCCSAFQGTLFFSPKHPQTTFLKTMASTPSSQTPSFKFQITCNIYVNRLLSKIPSFNFFIIIYFKSYVYQMKWMSCKTNKIRAGNANLDISTQKFLTMQVALMEQEMKTIN